MSIQYCRHVRWVLALGASLSIVASCASEVFVAHDTGVRAIALEHECAAAPADLIGDVTSILGSTEPLDPSQPQPYGSEQCGGFVFEFDNPDEEPLRGAWVQASGQSGASSDVLSESRCAERVLEADYWGFKKREWTQLASSTRTASFDRNTQTCALDALIEHPSTFEKLRIVARVAQGSETYPVYACVW